MDATNMAAEITIKNTQGVVQERPLRVQSLGVSKLEPSPFPGEGNSWLMEFWVYIV